MAGFIKRRGNILFRTLTLSSLYSKIQIVCHRRVWISSLPEIRRFLGARYSSEQELSLSSHRTATDLSR
ncbi:unnamed protein product [Cochlearia groenlandica]